MTSVAYDVGPSVNPLQNKETQHVCCNPTLGPSVRMQLTLPKVGKWSPPGLLKTQKTI